MRIEFYLRKLKGCDFKIRRVKSVFVMMATLLLAFFTAIDSYAQLHPYQGRVTNQEGVALEFANVMALSMPDSTVLQGSTTDNQGRFTIVMKREHPNLLFRVSMIGYETVYVAPSAMDSIILHETTQQLSMVTVSGTRKAFSQKGHNLICNVSGTSLSSETSVSELLGKLPGFYRQGEELKSMVKGSVKYFINNRPATESDISHLDVSTIKSIELDRHPGSRFSGEVGSVVLIRTHRPIEGFTSFVRSYARVNQKLSQGVDGEITCRYKKLGITLGGGYSVYQSKSHQENTFKVLDPNVVWQVTSRDEKTYNRTCEQMYLSAIDYNFNDNHWIRLSYRRQPSHSKIRFAGDIRLLDGANDTREYFKSEVGDEEAQDNLNLYYTVSLNKYWNIDLSSEWYHKKTEAQQILTEQKRVTKIQPGADGNLWGFSPRAIYRRDGNQLQMGIDWSESSVYSLTNLNITDIQSSDNKINETKRAAYAGYDWSAGNQHWELSLGLRYEGVRRRYHDYLASGNSMGQSYYSLLPSFSLSYKQGSWTHNLSYTTSTEYPAFSQIAGGEGYINSFNYKASNPDLERSLSHSIGCNVTHKWIYLAAEYTYTYKPIFEVFNLEKFQGDYRIKVTPQNLGRMQGIRFIANLAPKFGRYEPRLTLGYIQNFMTVTVDGNNIQSRVTKPFGILNLFNNFNLPNGWVLGLDLSCNGAGSNGYIQYSSSSFVDCSIQKYLFKKSLQISVKASDIFNASTPKISGRIMGVSVDGYSWMDRRNMRLNIIWHFNQREARSVRSSLSSEVKRL